MLIPFIEICKWRGVFLAENSELNFADSKFDVSRKHPSRPIKNVVEFTNLEVGRKTLDWRYTFMDIERLGKVGQVLRRS